jgi:pyridoxal phosphate enzyme (YggS family)
MPGDRDSEGRGPALVRSNLERIRSQVDEAARRAGRDPRAVRIVGVTKSVGALQARWLIDAGITDLGENRPEELVRKASDPGLAAARWHLIGTYQRRKVKATLGPVAVIHSIHSVPLAEAVSTQAAALGREVACLLQVNVSGEATKQGFSSAEIIRAIERLRALPAIRWQGLMTMAPAGASPPATRKVFEDTRLLRDRLRVAEMPLPDLSMGMSADFLEAVLEGATLIRIGTALFDMASSGPDS